MTEMEGTARKATGSPAWLPLNAGMVMMNAHTATNTTAQLGVLFRLSLRHRLWPGTAPSRENAKVMREALVTQAMPQNSWPMVEMTSTALAADDVRAVSMIDCEVPPAASIALVWVAAKVSASSTNQPNTAE